MSEADPEDWVLVQVVPAEPGRRSAGLQPGRGVPGPPGRCAGGGSVGARAVADSLPGLPLADGWRLSEVSGSFGICLTAEGNVRWPPPCLPMPAAPLPCGRG
jgi:hypothetical protein